VALGSVDCVWWAVCLGQQWTKHLLPVNSSANITRIISLHTSCLWLRRLHFAAPICIRFPSLILSLSLWSMSCWRCLSLCTPSGACQKDEDRLLTCTSNFTSVYDYILDASTVRIFEISDYRSIPSESNPAIWNFRILNVTKISVLNWMMLTSHLSNCIATNKVNKHCKMEEYNGLLTAQTKHVTMHKQGATKLLNKYLLMVTFEYDMIRYGRRV